MGQWTKALAALAVVMDLVPISSQHQHGGSRPSVIPVLRNLVYLLIYTDTRQACYPQTYIQAKKTYEYKNKLQKLANKLNNISIT